LTAPVAIHCGRCRSVLAYREGGRAVVSDSTAVVGRSLLLCRRCQRLNRLRLRKSLDNQSDGSQSR
jgi:hypothetical protein